MSRKLIVLAFISVMLAPLVTVGAMEVVSRIRWTDPVREELARFGSAAVPAILGVAALLYFALRKERE